MLPLSIKVQGIVLLNRLTSLLLSSIYVSSRFFYMASTQDHSIAFSNPGRVLAPGSPASETCFEDESGDDSGIEYCSRQTKSSHEKHLPERPDDGVRWCESIRQGLPELVEEAGLGIPKIALAGSTPIFIWTTTTDIHCAVKTPRKCSLDHCLPASLPVRLRHV
jgi:hypothetical protein